MTKPEILEKTPIPLAEVKSVVRALKKRDEELSFRAGKTEEYLNNAAKLTLKQSGELKKRLAGLDIPRFKDEQIVKVIDTIPPTVAELKVVLQGYTLTVSNENLSKIVDTVNEVLGSKE